MEQNMTAYADSKRFTPADVAAATGVSAVMQNQRYTRHVYRRAQRDSVPKGHGDTRLVTAETVYHIALTEACAKVNLPTRHAVMASSLFAEGQRGRPANQLFEAGRTLLVLKEDGAEIIN